MKELLFLYQHLPYYLNPVVISIGSFSLSWYALMYVVGLVTVYGLLLRRINKDPLNIAGAKGSRLTDKQLKNVSLDYLLYSFLGLLVGARLGYVLFYNLAYYRTYPWRIISPFDPATGELTGIFGMSYHGGLIGIVVVSLIFLKRKQINIWQWVDYLIPAVPAGYLFGRLGNFLNGELYGRVTTKWWGMYFPSSLPYTGAAPRLRHPSQLYEAFLEGALLFIILWSIRNKPRWRGQLLPVYLIGYSIVRFLVEFFREPDEQLGFYFGSLTLGQILSSLMLISGALIYIWRKGGKLV